MSEEPKEVKLYANEIFWRDHYDLLRKHGYRLRKRYQPGARLTENEMALYTMHLLTVDAIRIQDNMKVCLKRMSIPETFFARKLCMLHKHTPGNHSVPVIDIIPIPSDDKFYGVVVMPFLRSFDDPQFTTLGEIMEAVSQFLEGLEFIHKMDVAHRDACAGNMMMDASHLIPNGWHFCRPWAEDGTDKPIKIVSRSSVPVKYYFIDFGVSVSATYSNPDVQATGVVGQDRTVPELQVPNPTYNPFKLDIYQLGNVFKECLIESYEGLDFLDPLVTAMTVEDPSLRPNASDARKIFEDTVKDANPDLPAILKPGVKIIGSRMYQGDSEDEDVEEVARAPSFTKRLFGNIPRFLPSRRRM